MAGLLAVPLLSVLHLCPSTSGKLPQGHLAAVQGEDGVCILNPQTHRARAPGLSAHSPPHPRSKVLAKAQALGGTLSFLPMQTESGPSTLFLEALG